MGRVLARRSTCGVVTALGAACVALFVVTSAGQAKAPDLITSYKWLRTECVPSVKGNVRARVTVRMTVVNYDGLGGDWAQRMKAQARLVPTTGAGLSYFRNWSKAETGVLVVNRRHNKTFTLLTGNVRPDAAWKVQLKLVWDRPVRSDVVKELTGAFNASCSGGAGVGTG